MSDRNARFRDLYYWQRHIVISRLLESSEGQHMDEITRDKIAGRLVQALQGDKLTAEEKTELINLIGHVNTPRKALRYQELLTKGLKP